MPLQNCPAPSQLSKITGNCYGSVTLRGAFNSRAKIVDEYCTGVKIDVGEIAVTLRGNKVRTLAEIITKTEGQFLGLAEFYRDMDNIQNMSLSS